MLLNTPKAALVTGSALLADFLWVFFCFFCFLPQYPDLLSLFHFHFGKRGKTTRGKFKNK